METGGWSFREGRAVGRAMAEDLAEERAGGSAPGDLIPVTFDPPIKLVVPGLIRRGSRATPAFADFPAALPAPARGRLALLIDGRETWSARGAWMPERRILVPIPRDALTADAVHLRFEEARLMRVAAIDQGTTSTRCLVVEADGTARVAGSLTHAQRHPAPGWVEHDPAELLRNIRALIAAAGAVDAIALANQGESCLAWDAVSGDALSPVIVWQDARTADSLAARPAKQAARAKAISGLPLDPYFSASKLGWLMENVPAVATARATGRLRLGTTDAYFLDRLTGTFATDLATRLAHRPARPFHRAMERGIVRSPRRAARVPPPDPCRRCRFGTVDGVPLRVSIVDQQAALYGHGCRAPGDAKITFGTGAFLLAIAGAERPAPEGLLPTIGWQRSGEAPVFAIEGGVYDAGAALEWLRRLGLYSDTAELDGFTGPSALSRGLVFVPRALRPCRALLGPQGGAAVHRHGGGDRAARPGAGGAGRHRSAHRRADRGGGRCGAPITAISIDGGLSQSTYFARFPRRRQRGGR